MLEQMLAFLKSWFVYPDLSLGLLLIGIGLGIAFGAVWLLGYWPPVFKKPWLWAVAAAGAFLGLLAVVFVQIPLQAWAGQALAHFWSIGVLVAWLPLAGIPQVLLSGLVQEAAKMVPMLAWWWRAARTLDPKMGLVIGAAAGAGLGIFEAVWVHNTMFSAGWTWGMVEIGGVGTLAGFWERFFTVGAHIAISALAGYGLARGLGWQFYLIAAGIHSALNYSAVMLRAHIITIGMVEAYVAVVAVVVTAIVLWWRWQQTVCQDAGIEPDV